LINRRMRVFDVRCLKTYTRVIIVEYEDLFVIWVGLSANSGVARTKEAVRNVVRKNRLFGRDLLAAPRPVLAMSGDNDPFFAQRMPSFFPRHISVYSSATLAQARARGNVS